MRKTLLASLYLAASALATAQADPGYRLLATIPIPPAAANGQAGLTSFDISFVDPVSGTYYLADRSNAAVDMFDNNSGAFVGRAEGFAGQRETSSLSGPNGVAVIHHDAQTILYAGDGNSLLRTFDVSDSAHPVPGKTVDTGGAPFLVDGITHSPETDTLFAANNANRPPFATLVSTTSPLAPTLVKSPVLVPDQVASAGLGQPLWNAATDSHFVSVTSFTGADPGGLQEFAPDGAVRRTFRFADLGIASCAPAGLALGASSHVMVGCAKPNTQTLVLDPAGAVTLIAQLPAVSGSDQLWYDPPSHAFFVTGVDAAGHRVIDIFDDAEHALLQSIDLTALGAGTGNLHSVAVNPLNRHLLVPLTGAAGNTLCPAGCVAIFAP